jgi:mono/diheme cytochrome c family protein
LRSLLARAALACGLVYASASHAGSAAPVTATFQGSPPVSEPLRGALLISELSCTACHRSDRDLWKAKRGPDLSLVGSRITHDHLRRFVAEPSRIEPGTTMPDLLGHLPASERDSTALALAHFLATLGPRSPAITEAPSATPEQGRTLFFSVGCAACHSTEEALPGSIPLGPLAEKYSFESLTRFLEDPLAARPSSRMPDSHLSGAEAQAIAKYLLGDKPGKPAAFEPDPELAEQGRRFFADYRCSACHDIPGQPVTSGATAFSKVNSDKGCLSETAGIWPAYAFTSEQRSAIRAALKAPQTSFTNEEQIRLHLTRFNCIACHRRNDYGGIDDAHDSFFTSSDPNLGDQGRLPPALNNVGAKLNPPWLRQTLVQESSARPYLATRMPRFASGSMTPLIDLLVQTDQVPPVDPVVLGEENEAKRAGRDLAGTDGLGCVICHTFKDQKSGALGALDMTLMAQRVTRDWFHHYLTNPQSFSPSTVMPAFWVDGQSPKPAILGGDRSRQIEALWLFLSDGYSTDTPKGVFREPMRLLAREDEAVMLRRSYPGVGKRGIGVGYPGGVNLVFNAEQLCLATLWRGEFADPVGVWTSQGHGTVRPLSRDRLEISQVPELAMLDRLDSEWPEPAERPLDNRFRGYSLDSRRRPIFRYTIGSLAIEDAFVDAPDPSAARHLLRRTLKFQSSGKDSTAVFRAVRNKTLETLDPDRFRVGNSLEIKFEPESGARIVSSKDALELRIPIRLNAGVGTVVIDYVF